MVNKARAKGTSWETGIVKRLIEKGFRYAHRNPLSSPDGDVGGTPVVIEAKNHQTFALADWVNQAERSATRTGKPYWVFHKRRGKGVGAGYATTSVDHAIMFTKAFEICTDRGDVLV